MSALTRILNNQIFNQTIIASQKIAPGSITGTLFASNVTVPGDFLITGNLFVLGSSQTTTVASTNTYVNDPLIVLNNGFAGTNTYDEGLIFNRGSSENQAFIWSEAFKEFRLVATSEAGTTYGNITVSDLANLSVRHFYTKGTNTTNGNINQTGTGTFGVQIAGNVALNGPYLTTSQGNVSVFNVGATQINLGGEANLSIGASVGTTAIRNATLSLPFGTALTTGQTTFNLLNTNATTVNAFGAGTGITIGANSGFTAIQNANIWVPNATSIGGAQATVALLNTNATTINAFGAATTLNLGATSGIATINNTTVYLPTATNIAVGGASLTFANTVVATVNAFGDASTVFLGDTTGVVIARDALSATGTFWANSSTATTTQGTGALIVPTGGISVAGAANIAGAITTAGAAQFNNTITVGGVSSFTNTTNATDASGTTGALRIAGGVSVAKDLWIGGNIYASNIFGVTEQLITVKDPLLYLEASNTYPYTYDIGVFSQFVGPDSQTGTGNAYQHTGLVRDASDYTWKFFSNVAAEPTGTIPFDGDTIYDPVRAGNLTLTFIQEATSATTGSFKTAGGAGIGGNIFQTGTRLETSASSYIIGSTPTTVDAFKAATDLEIGATTGTFTVNNPTVVGTQATQALYNTVTSTLNFARAANITMGHTDGTTTLQGNANVRATTNGITFTQGALISAGAVGVAGNLNIKGNSRVTIGTDLVSGIVYPENQVQGVFSGTGSQRVGITNLNSNGLAEFSAFADNGSNIARFITTGISNSTFAAPNLAIGQGDGFTYVNLGNLFLGSTDYDVGILTGGLYANSLAARFSTIYSNVSFYSSRVATSATQAAFTVAGGAGIAGNLYVARGAVFNSGLSTDTFQIKSSTSGNVALFANLAAGTGTSESVIIGGANTVVQSGVTLKVNSTTSMMVPVGPTSGRPSSIFGAGYDVAGMMRFNSTINNLEFYDGTAWQAAGSTFTVISDRQFSGNVAGGFGNVDGTNTTFTLQSNATTAGTIISINGVMQFPTLAYSVTGNQLEFTEPPAPNDVIDARILTTTTTLSTLASGSGLNQFIAADTGAQIWTGTSTTIERIEVDQLGNFNFLSGNKVTYDQTVVSVPNTNLTLLDSFSANSYTTSKYVISMKQGTGNVQAMEALLTQSTVGSTAGTAYVTTYGIVNTGNTMGTLAANVDVSGSWTVKLWLIPNAGTAISNVKVMTTYIV